MKLREETLESIYLYRGRILNLRRDRVRLPDGGESEREIVEHNGGVCVAALNEKGELYFVRQYRRPYDEVVLELPAGKLEKGEDPLNAGIRELEEEAGVVADHIRPMGRLYPSPGYCGEVIWLYLATGLSSTKQHLDADEFLEVEKIPLDRAVALVMEGAVPDAKTHVLIMKTAHLVATGEI